MIECVPEDVRRAGNWKNEFFNYVREINCSMFFTWARERNKMKNHRAYIGPGAVEPITEDKIAVDVKFDPKNTKITYRSLWWGFRICQVNMGIVWRAMADVRTKRTLGLRHRVCRRFMSRQMSYLHTSIWG